jgi:putative hydrolase of the HAD superfamily
MQQGIVFDGDDTLWNTESLYDYARQQAREAVEAAGVDGEAWERIERRIDVENVDRLGHSVVRFPQSCVEAYEAACAAERRAVESAVRVEVRDAARTVFTAEAPLLPLARETLAALAGRGFRLALLTKGEPALQRRRIEQSGLAPFFDLVEIVDAKTPETFQSVLDGLGVAATSALSVGNSIRSDVLPSLAAGIKPIWIDAHVWEYERDHDAVADEDIIEVESLARLLDLVPA